MGITKLRSGLWGYRKSDVCEYIAQVNEQFSQKLMETIRDYDQQIGQLHEKIARLEAENVVLREESGRVTQVIVDAKKFSDDLKIKAEAENQKLLESNTAYYQEQLQRLRGFCVGIDKVRDSVRTVLESIDQELDARQAEVSDMNCELKKPTDPEESAVSHEQ